MLGKLWSTDLISVETASMDKTSLCLLSAVPSGQTPVSTANAVGWKFSEVTTKLALYLNSDPGSTAPWSTPCWELDGSGVVPLTSLSRGKVEKSPPGAHLPAWGTLTLLSC